MATQVTHQTVDDFDGVTTEGVETHRYADPATGQWYEVDLAPFNYEQVFGSFHSFVGTGRPIDTPTFKKSRSRSASSRSKSELAEIRAFAKDQGLEVNARGRVSAEVLAAWDNRDGVPTPDNSVDEPKVPAEPKRSRAKGGKAKANTTVDPATDIVPEPVPVPEGETV